MLRLVQGGNDFWKSYKTCHVGIHWIVLAELFQMSTHMTGCQSFSMFLHHFVLAKSHKGLGPTMFSLLSAALLHSDL